MSTERVTQRGLTIKDEGYARCLLQQLPDAQAVEGDKFGSVGLGLALEAADRYS